MSGAKKSREGERKRPCLREKEKNEIRRVSVPPNCLAHDEKFRGGGGKMMSRAKVWEGRFMGGGGADMGCHPWETVKTLKLIGGGGGVKGEISLGVSQGDRLAAERQEGGQYERGNERKGTFIWESKGEEVHKL